MEASTTPGVVFGGGQNGGFIFPAFLPAFDAVATLVHLLAMLVKSGRPVVEADRETCPAIHIAHQSVVTPWDQKGAIMRTLVERSSRRDLILVDGVKLPEDDGWVLVLPDPGGAAHPRLGRGGDRVGSIFEGARASGPDPPDDALSGSSRHFGPQRSLRRSTLKHPGRD